MTRLETWLQYSYLNERFSRPVTELDRNLQCRSFAELVPLVMFVVNAQVVLHCYSIGSKSLHWLPQLLPLDVCDEVLDVWHMFTQRDECIVDCSWNHQINHLSVFAVCLDRLTEH